MLDTTSRVDPQVFSMTASRCAINAATHLSHGLSQAASHSAFCSSECRIAFHNEPQRGQRSPTCIAPSLSAAVEESKPKAAPAATGEDDSADYCWAVPSQARIECWATNGDEIEIEQISPVHEDENIRIDVARSNAVRLARCILWAAGFKSVLIATGDGGGGYRDIEDGDLPEHFAGRP